MLKVQPQRDHDGGEKQKSRAHQQRIGKVTCDEGARLVEEGKLRLKQLLQERGGGYIGKVDNMSLNPVTRQGLLEVSAVEVA